MVSEIPVRGALRPLEAARWLGCSRDTIDRLIVAGALRSFTVGRSRFVSLAELRRYVEAREREGN